MVTPSMASSHAENAAAEADEAIREAEEEILKASHKVREAKAKGLDATDIESLLDEANKTLIQAKATCDKGSYKEAEGLAEKAEYLAKRARHLVEEILGKSEETECSKEEPDDEENLELKLFKDESSYIRIESEDSRVKLEMEKPEIRFKYYVDNETEVEIRGRFRSLIEFVDLNNDSKIQDGEVLWVLDLRDINWTFTHEKIAEENNTVIRAVYHANSTAYEIMIVARVYQRAVTETDTAENRTLVFDVDGGADEAKFDIIITRWTWISNQSQLAVLMKAEAKVEVEGAITEESAGVDEKQITLDVDDVKIKKIKITWVTKAKVVWPDGSETFEDVTVTYKSWKVERVWEEDGEEEFGVDLKVYFIYPNFGKGKLIHDPSLGFEDDLLRYIFTLITPETLLGTAITATAIAVAAIVFTRRRKRLKAIETTTPFSTQ
jgi:hypothetical protein